MACRQRVEHVVERHPVVERPHLVREHLVQPAGLDLLIVAVPAERELVRDERVHAVDRGELLGDGVRGRVMVLLGERDAGQELAPCGAPVRLEILLAQDAPPAAAHRVLQGRHLQERAGPLGGVDLHDQRRIDQPRLLEQPLAVLVRVLEPQPVDDRVVLAREEGVHHREADPPVAVHRHVFLGGAGGLRVGVQRQHAPARRARACHRAAAPSGRAARRRHPPCSDAGPGRCGRGTAA